MCNDRNNANEINFALIQSRKHVPFFLCLTFFQTLFIFQAYCGFYSPVEKQHLPAIATGKFHVQFIVSRLCFTPILDFERSFEMSGMSGFSSPPMA